MKITEAMVDDAARLAMLEVPAGERAALAAELGRIADYIDRLSRLDGGEGAPGEASPRSNVLRPDAAGPSTDRDALLACAPEAEAGAVVVPRTVE